MAREARGTKAKREIIYRIQNTCSNCRQQLIDVTLEDGEGLEIFSCRHIMGTRRTIRKTDRTEPSGYCPLYEPESMKGR